MPVTCSPAGQGEAFHSGNGRVQVRFQVAGDERLPILGAEDDVSDVLMERTSHGDTMVGNRGGWGNENATASVARCRGSFSRRWSIR